MKPYSLFLLGEPDCSPAKTLSFPLLTILLSPWVQVLPSAQSDAHPAL